MVEEAANADDAATLQTLKTMDSLESKIQNLKNAWQGFYANLGLEEVFKKGLDFLTGIINRLNNMPKIFGKIPAAAITIITNAINVIKGLTTSFINYVVKEVDRIRDALKNSFVRGASEGTDEAKKVVENKTLSSQIKAKVKAAGGTAGVIGRIGSIAGTALTTGALAIGDDKAATRGIMTGVGGLLSAAGNVAAGFATGGPYGALIAGLASIPNLLATITAAIDDIVNAENKRIRSLNEQVDKQKQAVLVAKSETKSYIDQIAKLEELKNKQYESNEAQQDYIDAENNLIDAYPQVIAAFDAKGQAIVDYTKAYSNLYTSIEKTTTAELEYQKLQAQLAEARYKQAQKNVDEKIIEHYTQGADFLPNLFGSQYNANTSNAGNMLSLLYMIFTDSEIGLGKENLEDITDGDWVKGLKILSSLNEEGISSLIEKHGTEIIEPTTGQGTSIKRFAALSREWEDRDSENPYETLDNWMKGLYNGIEKSEDFKLFLKELNIDSSLLDEDWQLAASVLAQYMDRAEMARAAEQRAAEIAQELTSTRRIAVDYLESISSELGSLNVDLAKELSNENGFFGKWIEYTAKQVNGGKKPTLSNVQSVLGTGDGTGGIIDVYRQMLDAGVYDDFIDFLSAPENISDITDVIKELNRLSEEYGIEFTQEMRQGIYNYFVENISNLIIDANNRYIDFINGIASTIPQDDTTAFSQNIQKLQDEIKNTSFNLTQSSLELIQTIVGGALKAYRNSDIFSANLYSAYALQVQNALLNSEYEEQIRGILTGIDLGDTQQLQQAISQLEKITNEDGTAIFGDLIETLHQIETLAANNLNTLFETALESAKKAYVEIDKIYSSYAKGISFEDLTSTVQLLQNSLKDKFNFDELFTFDKKIGQYVLTAQGLSEVIAVKSKEATEALDLAADRYKTAQTLIGKLSFTDDQTFTLEGIDWSSLGIDDEADQSLMQKYYQRAYKELTDANEEINADNLITQMLADIETEAEDFNLYRQKIEPLMKRQSAVNNLLANVDLEKILSGGVISDIASTILQTALAEIYENQPDLAKQVLSSIRNFNLGKATNQDFKVLYEQFTELGIENAYDLLTKSVSESLAASTSLINDLLSTSLGSTIILSEEQIRALAAAGYYKGKDVDEILASGIQSIQVGGEGFTTALEILLSQAANALRKGQITLDQYNKQVTQVAAFSDKKWGATPIIDAFGKASSLTADAVADIASSLGFTLSEDFDFTELTGITDYNGHQMVIDMQSFIYSLYTQASDSIKSFDDLKINWNDPRIVEAQSKLNEASIQQQQAMLEAQTKQLSAIGSVKPGQQFLDLSYVWKGLDENAKKQLAQAVSNAGGRIWKDTGLLELGNASIFAIAEAIKNSGALDQTEEAVAALEDAIISLLESLTDLLSKGLEGSLSNTEALDFSKMVSSRYGIEIDFTETEKGLKLSADSAERLAQHLYKAGTFQEKLAFKEYAKSLAGQAGTYKDIYSTMRKLKELETERAEKNGDITEDLRYQLALTREIAYAQMADTDSYNFMDFKMPSDFNGPANYWSSWETFMSKFREAKTNGYMEIEDFYNMINAVNALASDTNKITLFGQELNGSLESASAAIQAGFKTIGQIDGKGAMITFKGMGDDIFSGMESFGTSIDTGIHEFAQSQIDMIDALIGFVKAMAIMEDMGKLDIDSDGILEFTDLFEESGKILPAAATAIDNILGDKDLEDALTSVKISGKTLQDILIRAKDGSAEDIELLNQWYQIAKQMDFDITDINSIYQSIKDGLLNIGSDASYEISMGDETLIIDKGVVLVKKLYRQDDGTTSEMITTSDGKEFTDETEAYNHEILLNEGKDKTDFKLIDSTTATYTLGEATIKVDSSFGDIKYGDKGQYSTLKEALEAQFRESVGGELAADAIYNFDPMEYEARFNAFLSDLGLEINDKQEVVLKMAPEQASLEDRQLTAAEGLETAAKENTTAVTNLTSAINTLAALSGSTPREIMSAWESWDNPHGKEKKWDDFLQDYVQLHILTSPTTTSESIVDLTPNAASLPNTNISNEEYALLQVAELTSQLADAQEQTSLYQKLYQQKLAEAADLDAQIGTLTDQLTAKEEELATVKAEGEAAVEAAKAETEAAVEAAKAEGEAAVAAAKEEGEAAVAAITAKYESRITALNNTIDTLQETLAQTEANRVLAWQTATDWQKQLADKEKENAELLAQLTDLSESAKTDKNIPDDVYETAAKIAEQAYQAEREANANGETSGYIHIPQPWEVPETTYVSGTFDEVTDALDESAESQEESAQETNENTAALQNLLSWLESQGYDVIGKAQEEFGEEEVAISNLADWLGNFPDLALYTEDIESLWQAIEAGQISLKIAKDAEGKYQYIIEETGEAVKDSGKKMDKGRKDIQTASTSIRSSLSSAASSLANGLNTIVRDVSNVADSLNNIKINLPQITGSNNTSDAGFGKGNAAGSFGNALAAGTLMGELGPELWVSHGHYYVAGQNGAEFVNLPDDAIVFNHLQTERLLGKGKADGHGKPVTNERKATSLATGNVHGGLAMASASDTLAQLEQLRAMWEAIAKMPVSDLGKKAGSGGGGGGGGSDDTKAFIGDLQRWFNLEQQIAKLEKDITEQQKIRAKLMGDQVAHGKQIYESYRKEFNALTAEIDATQELTDLQKDWYQHRVDQFNSTGLNSIFTFDRETGLMQYTGDDKKGNGGGLDILATLYQTDAYGAPINPQGEKWDANGQLNYLRSQGISDTVLKSLVDSEGKTLVKLAKDGSLATDEKGNISMANGKTSSDLIEAFDTVINSWKDEMTELYDTYHENQMKVYDLQNNQNEIIQEVIDNQLSLEQRVLTALIDKAQKAIDDLQDSRDALADANQKYIDGLNDSLQKQKDMYDRNEAANDLNKLQRQLAILQRSGGSASQIRSLQQQINDQMQDAYFTAQQDQISAIQEAADKQIERLDYQIDLMTQTLEYQKENGLLWDEVYRIMTTWDAADISSFIADNTKALQGISSLDLKQQLIDVDTEIGIFKADWAEQVGQAVATSISQSRYHEPEHIESNIGAKNQENTSSGTTTAPASTSKGGGGSGGGNTGNNNGGQSKGVLHITYHVICTSGLTKGEATGGSPKGPSTLQIGQSGTISWNPYSGYAQGGFSISDTSKASISGSKITAKAAGSVVITLKYWDRNTNTATNGKATSSDKSAKMQKYAEGGLVDYTGPAQVHGSKSKPESFFDAQSTAILRDDVLGSINVLDSLLADVSTAGTNSLNLGTNESLSIANPVININVDKIANDYDAKRAGQLAFDEMVKIARQSGNRSLSRR